MIVGTNGKCIETCGDGKFYGLLPCDDGNLNNGDGCSSQCLIENGYFCYGGSPSNKETCSYLPTEIVGAKINQWNDIILNFSRPVNVTKSTLTSSDLKMTF